MSGRRIHGSISYILYSDDDITLSASRVCPRRVVFPIRCAAAFAYRDAEKLINIISPALLLVLLVLYYILLCSVFSTPKCKNRKTHFYIILFQSKKKCNDILYIIFFVTTKTSVFFPVNMPRANIF